jgi:hypothetical protein
LAQDRNCVAEPLPGRDVPVHWQPERGQMTEFKTFEDFWPYYLREHGRPETKTMHMLGTTIGAMGIASWLATRRSKYLAAAMIGSYGSAWLGHFVFEKNTPATFKYPLWSLQADLLMYRLWLTGDLDAEVDRVTRGKKRLGRPHKSRSEVRKSGPRAVAGSRS